jgi:hypothetical protein
MPQFGFVGPTYQSAALRADCQRAMNWYPAKVESGAGKSDWILERTPGLANFVTGLPTPIRALVAGENRLFCVAGSNYYEISDTGVATNKGNVGNDGNPAYIRSNGNQMLIVSNNRVYCDNGSGPTLVTFPALTSTVNTLFNLVVWVAGDKFDAGFVGQYLTINGTPYLCAQVMSDQILIVAGLATPLQLGVAMTGSPAFNAVQGAFLDGYFIVQRGYNSRQFNISGLYNGGAWSQLDYGVKQGGVDNIAAIFVDHRDLYLFGSQNTSEVWRNTGGSDFPFGQDMSAIMHVGCGAVWSPTRVGNGVGWLAMDVERGGPMAIYAEGYSPKRISTHAVEQAWEKYSKWSDAISYSYVENGHQFWIVNFPAGNATWCYDATTAMWHERGWWNGASHDRQRGVLHAYVALGNTAHAHYLADWQTGTIYKASRAYLSDAGTSIRRIRTAPHAAQENKRLAFNSLTLDFDVAGAADTINPSLDWSNDGGHSFGTAKQIAATGWKVRAQWRRLGSSRIAGDRVFRLTTSDSVDYALINAYLDVSPGSP